MPGPHDKIIADAAKSALGPLAFRRKGRSRTWLADHGWWLTIVEFQPSSWSKGSYLNVGAHWLWYDSDFLNFDYGGRILEHVEYQSDEQFILVANRLAERAANEANLLATTLTSLEAASNILLHEEGIGRHVAGGWVTYNAGMAAALVGRRKTATHMFNRVLEGPFPPGSALRAAAERMANLAADAGRFEHEVTLIISRRREALRLPALERPLRSCPQWVESNRRG